MSDERTTEEAPIVVKRKGNPNFGKKPVAASPITAKKPEEPQVRVNDRRSELEPKDAMGRPQRVPIGTTDRLAFPQRPGYRRRVVNDVDDGERIGRFEAAGYTKVVGQVPGGDTRAGADSQMGAPVVRSVGLGVKGVLMEIPEEFYNEDQAAKLAAVDETEESIRRQAEESGLRGKLTIERRK